MDNGSVQTTGECRPAILSRTFLILIVAFAAVLMALNPIAGKLIVVSEAAGAGQKC